MLILSGLYHWKHTTDASIRSYRKSMRLVLIRDKLKRLVISAPYWKVQNSRKWKRLTCKTRTLSVVCLKYTGL